MLTSVKGLLVIPSFLPSECQTLLLDRMLNRDLSKYAHKTNLDLHYDIQYPELGKSFLDYDKKAVSFVAKDPALHPNLSMERAMTSKLRWMTLGGQYDWTEKRYPDETPPVFPPDLYNLLHGAFPTMKPQAAIGMLLFPVAAFCPITWSRHLILLKALLMSKILVNFYSPGDTLSLHRDVSEDVDRGLVSISIGCDAIFIIGLVEDNDLVSQYQVLRLRSGDAVYMTGKSRYAWHGVPKIIPNTCPKTLKDWPGLTHPQWEGYMKTKRINLNVRQMFES